jgi:galactokinase/mevalonate kinase-like predicted kinase
MTENEINKIADIIAKKVIEAIEAKQKAWDEAYYEEMKAQGYELVDNHFEGIIPTINKLLREDYQLCASIDRKIAKLNEDIINYKHNTNTNR